MLLFPKRSNAQYAKLNDKLEDILAERIKCDQEVRKVLNDYFNLCAEEYLFYSEGRIHPQAWRAWCRGMLHYLRNDRVRQYWDQDVKLGSHYGLTLEIIEEGAARRPDFGNGPAS